MHRGNPHDRNPGSAGPPNIKQALRFLQPIGLDVGSPQRGLTSHTTRWARNRIAHGAPVRSWPFVAADLAKLHGPRPSQVVVRFTPLSREPSSQKTLRWREMDSNYWSRHGETPFGRAIWFPRTAPPDRRGTDPEGDEKFESGFLQQRVGHEPHGQNRTRSRPEPKVRIQLSPPASLVRT
jgi:hypothetical protein